MPTWLPLAAPGRPARSLRRAGLSGASAAGASAAGALVSVRTAYPLPPRAAPPKGWPPPRPVPRGHLAAAVVLGASGSAITDALGPYEVFARSPEFLGYTVSARPAAVACLGWRLDATACMPAQRVAPGALSHALTAAFPWFRPSVGIELPHAGQADGEFSLDPLPGDLAAHADKATARLIVTNTGYPSAHLRLADSPWPWRPATVFALTIAAAIGLALSPAAVARRHQP